MDLKDFCKWLLLDRIYFDTNFPAVQGEAMQRLRMSHLAHCVSD